MKPVILTALFAVAIVASFFVVKNVQGSAVNDAVTVADNPPAVGTVTINNNQATITLTPNTTTNVNVNATISDVDSCSDVTNGTATILLYRSGVTSSSCLTGSGNGVASSLNCYTSNAFTASSTCSGTSSNTTTTFPVQYYAQATDASSSFNGQNWMATVIFTDPSSSQGTADSTSASSSNDMATMVALNIPTSTINYGTLIASSTTGSSTQLLNIENAGNASDTVAVNGTAMTSGGNSVSTSSQHYATSTFTYGGGETALSAAASTITGINIAPISNFPIGGAGWQNVAALPYTVDAHSSIAYNGYLYTIGGVANGAATKTVIFAPINATGSLGVWTSTQSLPYTLQLHTSVAYNGYLYMIGGLANGGLSSTVLFAPINATGSIGAWSLTQALPYVDNQHSSVAYNGYLYTIGGSAAGVGVTSTVLFAPINATGSIGVWTVTQALPYPDEFNVSLAYNGYLYSIGGFSGAATKTVIFAPINATGSIGAWTVTQALPTTDYVHTSVAYNGYLYTIGGNTNGGITSTVLFAPINATGSIGAWSLTQSLPYIDDQHTSVAYNGYLYTIGGIANGAATKTVLFAPLNARSTYWGWSVPNGTANGSYSGTITFTASFSP